MVLSTLLPPVLPLTEDGGGDPPITRETLGTHILSEIRRCNGLQLPCFSETQILDGFWLRFGADGMTIAEQAFKVHDGMWQGAPITIQRFQAHHDAFFSHPLLAEARA